MPSPDFVTSANRRAEILHDLISLGVDRTENAISKRTATKQAHELILRYLREVLDRADIADAFAGAIGLIETPAPVDD